MELTKAIYFSDLITYLKINNIEYDETLEKETKNCIAEHLSDSSIYELLGHDYKLIAIVKVKLEGVEIIDFRKKNKKRGRPKH